MNDFIRRYFSAMGDIASTAQASALVGASESAARRYARENDLARLGGAFIFHERDVRSLADELGVDEFEANTDSVESDDDDEHLEGVERDEDYDEVDETDIDDDLYDEVDETDSDDDDVEDDDGRYDSDEDEE